MHAYAVSFSLLDVGPGDRVLDLGAGSGYGTALLATMVGPEGRAIGVEIDPTLVAGARLALGDVAHAELHTGDAVACQSWPAGATQCTKVTVGFGIAEVPDAWFDVLPAGAVVVAPVGEPGSQRLARVRRTAGGQQVEWFSAVRYVPQRDASTVLAVLPVAEATADVRQTIRLTVI